MSIANGVYGYEECLIAIQLGIGQNYLAGLQQKELTQNIEDIVTIILKTPGPASNDRVLLGWILEQHKQAWTDLNFIKIVKRVGGLKNRKALQGALKKGGLQEEVLYLGISEQWIIAPPKNLELEVLNNCIWIACLFDNIEFLKRIATAPSPQFQHFIGSPISHLITSPQIQPVNLELQYVFETLAVEGRYPTLKEMLRCCAQILTPAGIVKIIYAGSPLKFFTLIGEDLSDWATDIEPLTGLLTLFWWPLLNGLQAGQQMAIPVALAALQHGWFPDPKTLPRLLQYLLPSPQCCTILNLENDRWTTVISRLEWAPGVLDNLVSICIAQDESKLVCLLEAVLASDELLKPNVMARLITGVAQRKNERLMTILVELLARAGHEDLPQHNLSKIYLHAGHLQPIVRLWYHQGLDTVDRDTLLHATQLAILTQNKELFAFMQTLLTDEEVARDQITEAALRFPHLLLQPLRISPLNLELVIITVLLMKSDPLLQVLLEKITTTTKLTLPATFVTTLQTNLKPNPEATQFGEKLFILLREITHHS